MDRLIVQDTLNTKMDKISCLVKRQACIWITNSKLSYIYACLSFNFRFTHVPIPFVLSQESLESYYCVGMYFPFHGDDCLMIDCCLNKSD